MQELYKIGLPRPNLYQMTGGGLQVAWVVKDLIVASEWRRLSGVLFLVVTRTGLKVDRGVLSIDKAIRYCGPRFFNVNHGAPTATAVLHFDEERINNAIIDNALTAAGKFHAVPNGKANGSGFNQRFAIKGQDDFALDVNLILDECEVLKEAIETEGLDHSRDHWLNLIGLLAKNGDEETGRDIAHLISEKHPTHDDAETDKQFDYFRASGKGYTKCETFHASRPGLCELCKHRNKFKSPAGIQGELARTPAVNERDPNAKILDGEYFNSPAGVRRKKRGDEETHPLIWPKISVHELALKVLDTDRRRDILSFVVNAGNGWNATVEVQPHQFANSSKAANALGDHHLAVPDKHHKAVQEAMTSWVTQLRQRAERSTKYARLGWTTDNRAFVLGSHVYHADGSVEPISSADDSMTAFDAKGSFNDYRDAADALFSNERRPEAHAFVAASLGAPLLHLVGGNGIALNFCSARSGYGKTTLSQFAGSIWGDPRAMAFTLDDTENSIMRRISLLYNLPGLYDELRDNEDAAARICNMVFRLNSNVEKSRLTANSQLQHRGNWRTLMLFSTNYMFQDLMRSDKRRSGDAAVARALDFILPPLPPGSIANAASISLQTAKLDTVCNGWVGQTWAGYIATQQNLIRRSISRAFEHFLKIANRKSEEMFARNHCFAGAVMFAAAHHARTAGILPIDRQLVADAVQTAIHNAREARSDVLRDNDPIVALRDFMRQFEGSRAIVVRDTGKTARRVDTDRFIPKWPIVYEVNTVERMIYIDLRTFESWLLKSGLTKRVVMASLAPMISKELRPMAAQTNMAGPSIPVIAIKPDDDYAPLYNI